MMKNADLIIALHMAGRLYTYSNIFLNEQRVTWKEF